MSGMPWFPAVPPALAAADGGRIKKRAGLPKLLRKLFVKVLRLRPASSADEPGAAFEAYYGYRMGSDEEYRYYYSYGGWGSSWAGVLSSIPEEEDSSEEGTPDHGPGPAVLRKAQSERFVVGAPDADTVVHVEVLL
ncbi:uncharacterized protein LOC133917445 [Phragmites australis]|uniref:uncharacterized protein LOC133917445 n=1 Tax=Phragmites australis TaxID=29695 RepID=UPI002D778F2F|nr:uncharacterized protein LOC133917445 [Phragmites australis]